MNLGSLPSSATRCVLCMYLCWYLFACRCENLALLGSLDLRGRWFDSKKKIMRNHVIEKVLS